MIKSERESIIKDNFLLKYINRIFIILKQMFEMKKTPNPWQKSIGIAICTSVPMLLGMIFNQPQWSSIGALGSFAYLYFTNETYYRRAKKMFYVVIGFTLTVFLGTLVAPYPLIVIVTLGLIGAVTTFIFGVLRIPGPAGIFFILIYLMTTSMPLEPGDLFERPLIVFLSASFSWLVSMIAAPFDIHGPETRALKDIYMYLADFSHAIGKENISVLRNRVINRLREAEEMLLTTYMPWKESLVFDRLSLLYEQANFLLIELLDLACDKDLMIPKEISESIKKIGKEMKLKKNKRDGLLFTPIEGIGKMLQNIPKEDQIKYKKLIHIILEIEENINRPLQDSRYKFKKIKIPKKIQFKEALNKDSIAFNKAIRYGVVLMIACAVSYIVPFYKSYWIPQSCAAVMLGATIIATFNRAIERSVGTIIGLGLAAIILNFGPEGYILILFTSLLSAIIEFIIGKNYAMATIFITANGILMAESKAPFLSPEVFINARFINVIIGSAIGLIGTFLIGHRSASIRLKSMLLKLMESHYRLLEELVRNSDPIDKTATIRLVGKMKMNMTNLNTTYNTALGEIGNNRDRVEDMCFIIFSLEYISHLLEHTFKTKGYLNLSDDEIYILLSAYKEMIFAIEYQKVVEPIKVPIMDEVPNICKEINVLQDALSKISL